MQCTIFVCMHFELRQLILRRAVSCRHKILLTLFFSLRSKGLISFRLLDCTLTKYFPWYYEKNNFHSLYELIVNFNPNCRLNSEFQAGRKAWECPNAYTFRVGSTRTLEVWEPRSRGSRIQQKPSRVGVSTLKRYIPSSVLCFGSIWPSRKRFKQANLISAARQFKQQYREDNQARIPPDVIRTQRQ